MNVEEDNIIKKVFNNQDSDRSMFANIDKSFNLVVKGDIYGEYILNPDNDPDVESIKKMVECAHCKKCIKDQKDGKVCINSECMANCCNQCLIERKGCTKCPLPSEQPAVMRNLAFPDMILIKRLQY